MFVRENNADTHAHFDLYVTYSSKNKYSTEKAVLLKKRLGTNKTQNKSKGEKQV